MSGTTALIANRFQAEEMLGQGGMGTVYRGVDTHTGERVAIKALRPDIVERDPKMLARFEREGEALRMLNHPNIVKMLASVAEHDAHYIVMEFVGGGSLEDLLSDNPRQPVERVLQIGLDISDALTRAHRLKIIHRDIKPANVLLADDGTPRLTDFGIAYMGDRQRVTQGEFLIGTYAYLSPEVCLGEEPDGRADIWSFGVMLYEMLAGRRPFVEPQGAALLTSILSKPVPDLRLFRPDVPTPLRNLIHHMLIKDRTRRINSIRVVGTQMEALLAGDYTPEAQGGEALPHDRPLIQTDGSGSMQDEQTTVVRVPGFSRLSPDATQEMPPAPENTVARLLPVIARRGQTGTDRPGAPEPHAAIPPPLPTTPSGGFDLSALYVEALEVADDDPARALVLCRQILSINPQFMGGKAQTLAQRLQNDMRQIPHLIERARAAGESGRFQMALQYARDALTLDPGSVDAQQLIAQYEARAQCEEMYIQAASAAGQGRWRAAIGLLRDLRQSCPDYGDPQGVLRGRPISPETAPIVRPLGTLIAHEYALTGLSFSADGTFFASSSNDGTVKLWDARKVRHAATLTGHQGHVTAVAVASDNRQLASGGSDYTVRLWNLRDLREQKIFEGHTGAITHLAFSPNGEYLASASGDGSIKVWDVDLWQEIATFAAHEAPVNRVAFSADGTLLASASSDHSVRLWDTDMRFPLGVLKGHTSWVTALAFAPHGTLLASGGHDLAVRLWDAAEEQETAALRGHQGFIIGLAFAPDGWLLASAAADRTLRLWDLRGRREIVTLEASKRAVTALAFSPDGTLLLSGTDDGEIRAWGL